MSTAPKPYAVGLFYEPTLAAAIAAGVKLPRPRLTISVPYDQALAAGVVVPLSHIHLLPDAPPPDPSPNQNPPAHTHIPLPSTLFSSTSAIHPRNFDIAHSFVRLQTYDPTTMTIPDPAGEESTAAILYTAGIIKPGSLDQLHSFKVRRTSELRSVLNKEGPLLVEILELEQLREAPEVLRLLNEKLELGWACWPRIKTIAAIASVAEKAEELHEEILPKFRNSVRDRTTGRLVKRRVELMRDNSKSVRCRVKHPLLSPDIYASFVRAINKVHARTPQRRPSHLLRKIDEFAPELLADLNRPVVFVQ